jgi:hypothetical protein
MLLEIILRSICWKISCCCKLTHCSLEVPIPN